VKDVLGEHEVVLNQVKLADYCKKHPDVFDSSVGMHMRHSFDHFSTALGKAHLLEYDRRGRGTAIETDLDDAKSKLRSLLSSLDDLQKHHEQAKLATDVRVEFVGDSKTGLTFQLSSNIFRELAFVAHHGIHHLTIMQILLQKMGYQSQKIVGMAPSTANYKQS
jgi:hypothetical protein